MKPEKWPLLGNGCVNTQQYQNHRNQRTHETMKELLEAVFSIRSALRIRKETPEQIGQPKYKRFKHGGGQAYDCPSDQAAVIA
jgi:hypothetical protein